MASGPRILQRGFPLTTNETQLFSLLQRFIRENSTSTVVRAAGGWVREKLLSMARCGQIQSGNMTTDLDLTVSDMTGVQFLTKLNQWLNSLGKDCCRFGVIHANPERSKHLETATTTMFDLTLDFVHLRTESYSEGSRVPTAVKCGTPGEDALRRDFTVNALFYNIITDCIEDYTGKGLEDLKNRILRTPLAARATFKDDPLRLLRAARFCSVLDFDVDGEIMEACCDDTVLQSLRVAVSRERIGKEIWQMFSRSWGVRGLMLLLLKPAIFLEIFRIPVKPSNDALADWARRGASALQLLSSMYPSFPEPLRSPVEDCQQTNEGDVDLSFSVTPLLPANMRLAVLLHPLRGLKISEGPSASCRKQLALSSYVIIQSLKLPKKTAAAVEAIIGSFYFIREALENNPSGESEPTLFAECHEEFRDSRRVLLGLLLRQLGPSWPFLLGLHCFLALSKDALLAFAEGTSEPVLLELHRLRESALCLLGEIQRLQLDFPASAAQLEPIVNGHQLKAMFCKVKAEPTKLQAMLNFQIQYQLAHPGASSQAIEQGLIKAFRAYI